MTSAGPRISVIGGTGAEGRGIVLRFAQAGLPVRIGSRDGERATALADDLRNRHGALDLGGLDNGRAIADADVVILSVPFAHAAATIHANHGRFNPGSLVVDVTVPLVFEAGLPRLVPPPEGSAAEHLRRQLPESVLLACAFKTMPARMLEHVEQTLDCDEFVCGDSLEACDRVVSLLRRLPGLRPIDVGPLEAARAIEHMTWLAILVNKRYKSHNARFKMMGI